MILLYEDTAGSLRILKIKIKTGPQMVFLIKDGDVLYAMLNYQRVYQPRLAQVIPNDEHIFGRFENTTISNNVSQQHIIYIDRYMHFCLKHFPSNSSSETLVTTVP